MAPHQVNCTQRNKTNILAFLRKTQIKCWYVLKYAKKNLKTPLKLRNYQKKSDWFQNKILKIYVIFSYKKYAFIT